MPNKPRLSGRAALLLLVLSVGAGMGAFFLPWVVTAPNGAPSMHESLDILQEKLGRVEISVRRGGKVQSVALQDALSRIPNRISGYAIPIIAHRDDAATLLAFAGLTGLAPDRLSERSCWVYAVPGALIALSALAAFFSGRRSVALGVAALSAGLAVIGAWKLQQAVGAAAPLAIHAGVGAWLSVGAFGLLSLAALLMPAEDPPG